MNPDFPNDISRMDAALAGHFDEMARKGEFLELDDDDQRRVRRFTGLWRVMKGMRVLEPGCGGGRLTERLARAVGPEGEVYACDISPAMIEKALERALPPHVSIECRSVYEIPRGDDHFDQAICLNTFPHFSDIPRALREICRVLKPGGDFWVCHLKSRDEVNNIHRQASPLLRRHLIPDVQGMRALFEGTGLDIKAIHDNASGYMLNALKPLH